MEEASSRSCKTSSLLVSWLSISCKAFFNLSLSAYLFCETPAEDAGVLPLSGVLGAAGLGFQPLTFISLDRYVIRSCSPLAKFQEMI